MAPYGLVEGERVSGVMAGTLRAGKMDGYRYYYFGSILSRTRVSLALNFGWALVPRPHESLEMKVDSYYVYINMIKQCAYLYTCI